MATTPDTIVPDYSWITPELMDAIRFAESDKHADEYVGGIIPMDKRGDGMISYKTDSTTQERILDESGNPIPIAIGPYGIRTSNFGLMPKRDKDNNIIPGEFYNLGAAGFNTPIISEEGAWNEPEARTWSESFVRGIQEKFPSWSPEQVLRAYNWGPTAFKEYLEGSRTLPSETENYSKKVFNRLGITPGGEIVVAEESSSVPAINEEINYQQLADNAAASASANTSFSVPPVSSRPSYFGSEKELMQAMTDTLLTNDAIEAYFNDTIPEKYMSPDVLNFIKRVEKKLDPNIYSKEDAEKITLIAAAKEMQKDKSVLPVNMTVEGVNVGMPIKKNRGGEVPSMNNKEVPPMFYAKGTDTVPAMLTPGEAVIPMEAAQHPMYKPLIKEMIKVGRNMQDDPTKYYKQGTEAVANDKVRYLSRGDDSIDEALEAFRMMSYEPTPMTGVGKTPKSGTIANFMDNIIPPPLVGGGRGTNPAWTNLGYDAIMKEDPAFQPTFWQNPFPPNTGVAVSPKQGLAMEPPDRSQGIQNYINALPGGMIPEEDTRGWSFLPTAEQTLLQRKLEEQEAWEQGEFGPLTQDGLSIMRSMEQADDLYYPEPDIAPHPANIDGAWERLIRGPEEHLPLGGRNIITRTPPPFDPSTRDTTDYYGPESPFRKFDKEKDLYRYYQAQKRKQDAEREAFIKGPGGIPQGEGDRTPAQIPLLDQYEDRINREREAFIKGPGGIPQGEGDRTTDTPWKIPGVDRYMDLFSNAEIIEEDNKVSTAINGEEVEVEANEDGTVTVSTKGSDVRGVEGGLPHSDTGKTEVVKSDATPWYETFLNAFGFTKQDALRALLYYAVSRASGASHGGSLRWAGQRVLYDKEKGLEAKSKLDVAGASSLKDLRSWYGKKGVRAAFNKEWQDQLDTAFAKGDWKAVQALMSSAVDNNFQGYTDFGRAADLSREPIKVMNVRGNRIVEAYHHRSEPGQFVVYEGNLPRVITLGGKSDYIEGSSDLLDNMREDLYDSIKNLDTETVDKWKDAFKDIDSDALENIPAKLTAWGKNTDINLNPEYIRYNLVPAISEAVKAGLIPEDITLPGYLSMLVIHPEYTKQTGKLNIMYSQDGTGRKIINTPTIRKIFSQYTVGDINYAQEMVNVTNGQLTDAPRVFNFTAKTGEGDMKAIQEEELGPRINQTITAYNLNKEEANALKSKIQTHSNNTNPYWGLVLLNFEIYKLKYQRQ